jgi:hypothetical protein
MFSQSGDSSNSGSASMSSQGNPAKIKEEAILSPSKPKNRFKTSERIFFAVWAIFIVAEIVAHLPRPKHVYPRPVITFFPEPPSHSNLDADRKQPDNWAETRELLEKTNKEIFESEQHPLPCAEPPTPDSGFGASAFKPSVPFCR